MVATSLTTALQLLRLPQPEGRFELIEGKLEPMSPTGLPHTTVSGRLNRAISAYLLNHDIGELWPPDAGIVFERDPDTVLAPDWSVIATARLATIPPLTTGFPEVVPELVIEIKSPGDREPEIARKLAIYQRAGVPEIWWLRPDSRSLTVHWLDRDPLVVIAPATFTASTVLPGFTLDLGLVFA